jgi:hypothetical protein
MANPIAIAGVLAIVALGLGILVLRILGMRPHQLGLLARQNQSALWLTEKSVEQDHEEHREYVRERAKNDRHQDLD